MATALGLLLIGLGGIAILTAGHTASHQGLCSRRWANLIITFLSYPFFFSVPALYWWHKHVVVHHPSPNVMGVDEDSDFLPFFATTATQLESSRGFRRLYHRSQWLFVPLMLALAGFSVQIVGWSYLIRAMRKGERLNRLLAIDLACLTLHWIVFLALPLFFFPIQTTLLFYIARTVVIGMAIFMVAAPAHLPEEAAFVEQSADHSDHLLLQTSVTLNFSAGPIGRFFICGSEYQIEHHLFPGMNHLRYPEASKIVRTFCEANGYPYRTLSWATAIWKSMRVFWRPKPVRSVLARREAA
jgi:fatty acid desaturase